MNEPTTISHAEPMAMDWAEFFGEESPLYQMAGASALAVVPVSDVLVPGLTMKRCEDAMRAAASDPNVGAVVLDVDCPGGYVRGMDDMVSAMRELAAAKPVYAFASRATSGGYWAACMAREIAATPNAVVGSIGVMGGSFWDVSKMLADKGISVRTAASSQYKAMGMPGVPITDEMFAVEQRLVDDMAAAFFGDVAKSRRMTVEQVKSLNAEVVTGQRAYALGLVDRVVSSKAAYINELAAKYPTKSNTAGRVPGLTAARAAGATAMSDNSITDAPATGETTPAQSAAPAPVAQPAPATAEQLAAAIDDPAYCFACIREGKTLTDALTGYVKHLKAKPATPAAAAPASEPAATGVRPVATGSPLAMARAPEFLAKCASGTDVRVAMRQMFTADELRPVTDVVLLPKTAVAPRI